MAEDMAQETWIRVVQAAPRFEARAAVSSWILTIAKNLCLSEIRKRNWEEELPPDDVHLLEDPQPGIHSLLEQTQNHELVRKLIRELPEKQRVILTLWLSEEKDQAQMALELGMTVGALKVQLHRIKEKLSEALKEKS